MPFLDTNSLPVIERLPGWHGRYFHSQNMTFAHYDFTRGSSIHEHFHPEEEVYEVIEGELEVKEIMPARIPPACDGPRCCAAYAGSSPAATPRSSSAHRLRIPGHAEQRPGVGRKVFGFSPEAAGNRRNWL